jgi:hypothetical protein
MLSPGSNLIEGIFRAATRIFHNKYIDVGINGIRAKMELTNLRLETGPEVRSGSNPERMIVTYERNTVLFTC